MDINNNDNDCGNESYLQGEAEEGTKDIPEARSIAVEGVDHHAEGTAALVGNDQDYMPESTATGLLERQQQQKQGAEESNTNDSVPTQEFSKKGLRRGPSGGRPGATAVVSDGSCGQEGESNEETSTATPAGLQGTREALEVKRRALAGPSGRSDVRNTEGRAGSNGEASSCSVLYREAPSIRRGLRRTPEELQNKQHKRTQQQNANDRSHAARTNIASSSISKGTFTRGLHRTPEELQGKQQKRQLQNNSQSEHTTALPRLRNTEEHQEEQPPPQDGNDNDTNELQNGLADAPHHVDTAAAAATAITSNAQTTTPSLVSSNSGLAVAHAVTDEESQRNLPIAVLEEDSSPADIQQKQQWLKRWRWRIFVFLLVMLALPIIVVLSLTLPNMNKSDDDQESTTLAPTNATTPTPAPTTTQSYVMSLLPTSTRETINSIPNSPQDLAYDFVIKDPLLDQYPPWRIQQRFALKTFYHATSGRNWKRNDGWANDYQEPDECQWLAQPTWISPASDWINISLAKQVCNDDGHYVGLWQLANDIHGTLPPEVFLLTSLRSINLDAQEGEYDPENKTSKDNFLAGFIPSEISQCTNLDVLSLANHNLTHFEAEHLPPSLQFMRLLNNGFTGTFPTELGTMTSLTWLDLHGNQLTGPLPTEVGTMTSLTRLYLSSNLQFGPLPTDLGLMASLEHLSLASNQLTGPLPTELGIMTSLKRLYIYDNQLTGPLPTELGTMTSLSRLFVNDNQLTGPLPTELGTMTSLTRLDLSSNQLTGPLPTELGTMTSLNRLYVYDNQLTGPLPTELGTMTSLTRMRLYSNWLTGSLPTEVGFMNSLQYVDLIGNQLTGTLPTELGILTNVTRLVLSFNHLTGTLPLELGLLVSNGTLGWLEIQGNDFFGFVPEEVCSLDTLDFDCSILLCGCTCPCSEMDDPEWPGAFPSAFSSDVDSSTMNEALSSVVLNTRTDIYPEDTSWTWSKRIGLDEWETIATGSPSLSDHVYSSIQEVEPESIYRWKVSDRLGDGTCCGWSRYGWFSITNGTASTTNRNGTIVWSMRGNFENELEVFLWIDGRGMTQLVEYTQGQGYALVLVEELEDQSINNASVAQSVIVVPEEVKNTTQP